MSISRIARLNSLLFVSSKPLSAERLSRALELDIVRTEELIDEARELFKDEVHGFSLHEVNGGWQFRTAPEASTVIRRLIPPKERRMSRAAAETLAVIAYKQPVERAEIESIRGVDALPTLKTLLDSKLVRAVGKQETPGTPVLYGTTANFLEKFGLRDLSELPPLRELEQILNDPGEPDSRPEDATDFEQSSADI